jgi:hypothetical protein
MPVSTARWQGQVQVFASGEFQVQEVTPVWSQSLAVPASPQPAAVSVDPTLVLRLAKECLTLVVSRDCHRVFWNFQFGSGLLFE